MLKLRILVFASLLALAAAPASAQTRMIKCKDSKGVTYYTQTPPPECLGKEMEELSRQGSVLKKREAALTPEQLAAREEDRKRKAEQDALAKEEKRKNQALLNTYSSEKDIEDGRLRALKQAELATKEIEKRIAEAHKRAKTLAAEKEFYVKKPMPKKLREDISNNESDLQLQENALAGRKKEVEDINAKYDEDLRRYREIKGIKAQAAASPKK
ncbi:MAG: DUF4124 domain-containing protein [Burkholderiales bacterium]|nr:DUF4124 domain-containing protein [Burkholderiales bacterium]